MNDKYQPSRPDRVFFGWALLNIPFLVLLTTGLLTGYLQPYIYDITYITHVIIAITVVAIFHVGLIAWRIAGDFRGITDIRLSYHANEDAIYHRIDQRLDTTRYIATMLIGLGFLGTVIGVIIGLQNFPADAFNDATAMQAFIRQMLVGFSTELHTLVAGLIGSLWLSFNVHILERYDSKLFLDIIE